MFNNKFVVAWTSVGRDGSGEGIYGQMFNNDGVAFLKEFKVNVFNLYGQYQPAIASFNNSDFMISWTSISQDGSGAGIYARILNETLVEELVATTTSLAPSTTQITSTLTSTPPATSTTSANTITSTEITLVQPSITSTTTVIISSEITSTQPPTQIPTLTFPETSGAPMEDFTTGGMVLAVILGAIAIEVL